MNNRMCSKLVPANNVPLAGSLIKVVMAYIGSWQLSLKSKLAMILLSSVTPN